MFYLLTKDTFLTPIQRISNALKTHKPFYLLSLAQQKNELTEITTLILEYEKQKQLLEHYKAIDENTIVSKTDAKGIIRRISMTSLLLFLAMREELIGKPHNIVHHPDNSPEFFYHEMWKELKSGKTWKGIVKSQEKRWQRLLC